MYCVSKLAWVGLVLGAGLGLASALEPRLCDRCNPCSYPNPNLPEVAPVVGAYHLDGGAGEPIPRVGLGLGLGLGLEVEVGVGSGQTPQNMCFYPSKNICLTDASFLCRGGWGSFCTTFGMSHTTLGRSVASVNIVCSDPRVAKFDSQQ